MFVIREFKFIIPVEEESIIANALENMFSMTDVKQLTATFTPTDFEESNTDEHTYYKFNVNISIFDGILGVQKKISKAIMYMKSSEYTLLMSGMDELFIENFMNSLFPRYPDIMNGLEYSMTI